MAAKVAAGLLAAACVGLAVVAVVATVRFGWTLADAVDNFVASNLVIGLSFGLCGALIVWHRPRHPVGWMYAIGGLCQLISAAAAPVGTALQHHGGSPQLIAGLLTVFAWSWPIHIGAMLPLSLFLLPDGKLPSPHWRPAFIVVAVTAPLFVIEVGTQPGDLGGQDPLWTLPHTGSWTVLWTISEIRWLVTMAIGIWALAVRYRRGSEIVRRQLLWLLAAAVAVFAAAVPWSLVAGTPVIALFAIPLLPIAITVAILRYGMLDIRLVLARGLTYAVLSAFVLAGYAVLVLALSGVASALLASLLVFPLRARVQQAVERLVYGDRDPLRVASRVGGRLTDLEGSLDEVRTLMRLPYVAVTADGTVVCSAGVAPAVVVGRPLGEGQSLVIGLRPGQPRLSGTDERIVGLLAGPLAVACHATVTAQDLQHSRERLVTAVEEERMRLRRDLHDGLGPLLTGVALASDAAANLASTDPAAAEALLRGVRTDTRTAIAEIRRVVEDLRPPALAELGLLGALQARAAQTVRRADGSPLFVTVEASPLVDLPPAIEVAAYRIATEALNNVVRHSTARSVRLSLRQDGDLVVEVVDDGGRSALANATGADDQPGRDWSPGVGITAMRERAAELGGACEVGPSEEGGAVRARLPLVPA